MSSHQSSDDGIDPLRPADHADSERPAPAGPNEPRLGVVGWLRFAWRQLTSMRTALVLLLLLAVAAIPGSLVPQVTSDPNGVIQYQATYPEAFAVLDALGVFSTYSSVWFSAIYLLLFVSLIGCVIPRARHHWTALRARPPRTPARLNRLEGRTTRESTASVEDAVTTGMQVLRKHGYRVQRYGDSVSAERGYWRETGNLVFHGALVGVLIAVGIGGGFGYTGQRVVAEGYAFTNSRASYDSFSPGRFFTDAAIAPFSILLDSFDVVYEEQNVDAYGQPLDFTANVTVTQRGQEPFATTIKVNEPLTVDGTQVYLLGNGFAPVLDGTVVFSQPTLFQPQDVNLTSIGVVKIPDGLDEQVGLRGFLYPTATQLDSGAYTSVHPELRAPLLTLEVYVGDLGLDSGAATNAYVLNTDGLEQVAGRDADEPTIMLALGETADLPNGLGTIELSALPRFAALDIHSDPSQGWVLLFASLSVAGLLTSLFIPRRRVWIKATAADDGVELEYAGLARGEDPRLADAVSAIADAHVGVLSATGPAAAR
jgi:cytochrome c biogenesis protein